MNEEEKKDNSAPWINYRTDNAEQELARQKRSANEDVNKSKKRGLAEMGDATGGEVKTKKQILKEGMESQGKGFAEKYGKEKSPQTRLLKVDEQKEFTINKKDLHLKSSTALTHPEESRQNLKGVDKAQNIGKTTTPTRGGGFRGGGIPQIDEPDEILKKKQKALSAKDILSQKVNKPDLSNLQQKQEFQQQQAQDKSKNPQSLGIQKLSVRERTDLAKAAKEMVKSESGTIDKANVSERISIKERIAQAKARKEGTPEKASVAKEKNKEVAVNKVKQLSPKTIKR